MFNVPKRYSFDKQLDRKTFTPRDMKKGDRDRIRGNLLSAALVWQIAGEEIPSRVDDTYNCSVIMGLELKLRDIRDATFFAEQVQHMIKAPCVVRFYDKDDEVFSFAHKRLNQNDSTQIVVLDRVQTPPLSLAFPDKTADMLHEHLDFDRLRNRTDKLCLYLEAMVKAFLISNLSLYSGIEPLLDTKVWYNSSETMTLFEQMKELARLHRELDAAQLPGDKAKLMGEIKKLQTALSGG